MQKVIKSSHLTADVEKTIKNIHFDKLFILTDEHTHLHCLPLLEAIPPIAGAREIVIAADDTNKTIESLGNVWTQLTVNGATRHSLLINLGGGMVTGPGRVCRCHLRSGASNTSISPTTLLGAVDASVGGKTGINFAGYKNEIGSF